MTGVPGRIKYPVSPASTITSVFVIFNTNVEYDVSMGVWLLVATVFNHNLCLRQWQGGKIYCSNFGGWVTTSFHIAVLDCIYLYVPFLNPLPLTIICVIGAVVDVVSKSPAVPLPNLLFGVAV